MSSDIDVVVIGSGMGGATFTCGLAPSGARILILERGEHLTDTPESRDARAIFQRGFYRPKETWFDAAGDGFNPGNYYYVGGNTKFYGAVLIRYRKEDFSPIQHADGETPGWPISYETIEPWYARAEALYQVRGSLGEDPTEPAHSNVYSYPPVPDEPAIAAVRERLRRIGLHPFHLPLGVDIDRWMARAKIPWDAFPNADGGKMDAQTCALASALAHDNVTLETGARATKLSTDASGRRIESLTYEKNGETLSLSPRLVVVSAGAVHSALLLLASANTAKPKGLANSSDQVGRNFMNHNSSAALAIDPRAKNDSIYQKTLGLNDFYLNDGAGGPPLGNVQLLGRVSGPILKSQMRAVPEFMLSALSSRAVDFYLMSEDLPHPDSRVWLEGSRVVLNWRRSNMAGHAGLAKVMRERLRAAGYPIVLIKAFDRRTPSHQSGTIRMGDDPARAVVDSFGRTFDHPNLFVVDASILPTSAAVNPSLTVAALALRAADHVRAQDLAA
jgi:choline dehydrogenase-like flavoprotein